MIDPKALRERLVGTFLEEAEEHLGVLEDELLRLDERSDDETLNRVFRAAHSLKGGSASVGIEEMAALTHRLETVLDALRSHRLTASRSLTTALLQVVDALRALREARARSVPSDPQVVVRAQAALTKIDLSGAPETPDQRSPVHGQPKGGYRITYAPNEQIYFSGNEPSAPIHELRALGPVVVRTIADQLPSLSELDPERFYLSFELSVGPAVSQADIDQAFDWVSAVATIKVEREAGAPDAQSGPAAAKAAAAPSPGEPVAASSPLLLNAPGQPVLAEPVERPKPSQPASSIRVATEKLDALIDMVGELVITQSMLGTLEDTPSPKRVAMLRETLELLERNTRALQERVMQIRMLPVGVAFQGLARATRDACDRLGKQAELEISGEQTEVDKTILERLSDPLVHIVRNAIDHGLEMPADRLARGKPPHGTIRVRAHHQAGRIVIEVSDDGSGIDASKIQARARQQGLLGATEALAEREAFELLFRPGFSTASKVTEISGRGVGLDVVQKNLRSIGGTVTIRSRLGAGTTFTLRLPLTVSILDAQLLRVGDEIYILPLVTINESLLLEATRLHKLPDGSEKYSLRGENLTVIRLSTVLSVPESTEVRRPLLVVIETDAGKAALAIDDLLGQQQVVLKSLDSNYGRVEGIAGGAILPDGSVALILDPIGLISLGRRAALRGMSKGLRLGEGAMRA